MAIDQPVYGKSYVIPLVFRAGYIYGKPISANQTMNLMYLLFREQEGFISCKRKFFGASKEVSLMVEKANERD